MAVLSAPVPPGFILAMVPDPSASNHLFPWSVDPATRATKQLQQDYIMASVANTANGGAFNKALGKAQFVGQSLTMENGEPNPTMNFLVTVDATGDYTSTRLISYGGLVYGIRAADDGRVFGMEQFTPTTDARVDLVEDTGRCTSIVNTTAKNGYLVNHIAMDAAGTTYYVTVKNSTGANSLQTISLTTSPPHIANSVDLPNTGTKITLCHDAGTHALYSLDRNDSTGKSTVSRVNPNTGQYTTIATVDGRATVADCRGGFFHIVHAVGSTTYLTSLELATGTGAAGTLSLRPAPVSIIFFPQ
jgi:hypothetical protein